MTTVRDRLENILTRLEARAADERVFLRLYHDQARAAADAADARKRSGVSLGPLDGTIVSIKDLFDVAGEPTTAGSILARDFPPASSDATVVRRLRQAGAVIIGKTNMTEFAATGMGLNPHYGTPGSASDPTRIPGGSSSGAGVSVAEGTSEIAIGSDTGGSVRVPAAFNGVVGFKPTADRVPQQGVFPLSYSLDSIGPLARNVQDCAAADAVMAGEEPSTTAPLPLKDLRVGVPRGPLLADTAPAVAAAFDAGLQRLSRAGARIVDHNIEDLLDGMKAVTTPISIVFAEAAEIHADWLESKAAAFDPRVHRRIVQGATVSAPAYIRMVRQRRSLIAAMDARLGPLDVLALPTIPFVAPAMAALLEDDALFMRTHALLVRNTIIANQFDLTAISLPLPAPQPIGFMLLARRNHDHRLLRIAASAEAAFA
ncbi:amidase [Reyranella sp. CPCC 100927]|uniref:amidase n=1 Tax=Reyranella sp. CPCC 100927 TaxID=2599616 RepID=UPI0011B41A67|nr:amidase [Reyranella sp. CPCC 100927]TWS99605.1 amidase [Reyranella sp. CPCC 100927]